MKPQIGDEWEVRIPGQRKLVKIIGRIYVSRGSLKDDRGRMRHRRFRVEWKRLPKGRYSGMTLRKLMRYGKRLSTKAERDLVIEQRFDALAKAGRDGI